MALPDLNSRYICKDCKRIYDFYRKGNGQISWTTCESSSGLCLCRLFMALIAVYNADDKLPECLVKVDDNKLVETLYHE